MSIFPFNNDFYQYIDSFNGSPISYKRALSLPRAVRYFHTEKNTSNFSQSEGGIDVDSKHLAWGIIESLSDPNFVKRTILVGKNVEKSVKLVLNTELDAGEGLKIILYEIMGDAKR